MEKPNEQRTILKLLELLRKELESRKPSGLCSLVIILFDNDIISILEKKHLLQYIESNRPYYISSSYRHWFQKSNKKPRLDWLDQQIKIERKKEESYIVMTSSICDVEVSYEIVNGKRTKQIIETGTTYQEKKL